MTPHKNPRNHVALLVGDVLYLPDGRAVAFAEVTGWEEADEVEPTPACLAAARAAQAVLDARPMPKPVSRPLPVLEAPRAWKEAPEVAAFRARVAQAVAAIEGKVLPGASRTGLLAFVRSLADHAGAPTDAMLQSLEHVERQWDPGELAAIERQAAEVVAWVGVTMDGNAGFLSRVAVARLRDAQGGFVGAAKMRHWRRMCWPAFVRMRDGVAQVERLRREVGE